MEKRNIFIFPNNAKAYLWLNAGRCPRFLFGNSLMLTKVTTGLTDRFLSNVWRWRLHKMSMKTNAKRRRMKEIPLFFFRELFSPTTFSVFNHLLLACIWLSQLFLGQLTNSRHFSRIAHTQNIICTLKMYSVKHANVCAPMSIPPNMHKRNLFPFSNKLPGL